MSWVMLLAGWIGVMVVGALLASCVVVVRQKSVKVIERFGKFSGIREPGLSFKLPTPFETVAGTVSLQLQQLHRDIDVKTADNAFLKMPISVQYRVIKPVRAFYELADHEAQILAYVSNVVRSAASKMKFDEVFQKRETIAESVEQELSKHMDAFGFEIATVLVDQPQPDDNVRKAFNGVIASQQEREAAHNKGEAERIRMVAHAAAEKEAKKLQGEGIAAQRKAIADGIKESVEDLRAATGQSEDVILSMLMMTNQWDTIRDASANPATVILMPYAGEAAVQDTARLAAAFRGVGKNAADRAAADAPQAN